MQPQRGVTYAMNKRLTNSTPCNRLTTISAVLYFINCMNISSILDKKSSHIQRIGICSSMERSTAKLINSMKSELFFSVQYIKYKK